MFAPLVIYDYFVWHYTRAWRELGHVWWNLLWFTAHVFSIPQLSRSWVAPFKRITEEKQRGFNLEAFASRIIINLLSRVIGGLVRTFIIGCGLVALCLVLLAGVMTYIVWAVLPFMIVGGLITSVILISTSL